MHKRQRQCLQLMGIQLAIIALNTGMFALAWSQYYCARMHEPFYIYGNYLVITLFAGLYMTIGRLYRAFALTISRTSDLIYSNCIALLVTDGIMYIVIWLLLQRLPNLLPGFATLAIQCLIAVVWARVANRLTNRIVPPVRILLLYGDDVAWKKGLSIAQRLPWRFHLEGSKDIRESNFDFENVLADAEAVMLCGVQSSLRNEILKYCLIRDIRVYVRPSTGDFILKGAEPVQMNNLPVMICQRATPNILYLIVKRLADILISLCGLIVLSPVMLITACAIKLYDGGPIFYFQERLTKDRKIFSIIKFRSMHVDAEKDGVARLAGENDARITPVGRIIRRCRIDELPQLLCVLRGDISCVGPRPERPSLAAAYEETMPEFALRLQVKAGLTGYAQVYGKYNTPPYDKMQMDLLYISRQSIATDLKIMLATIKILFLPESTEGVSECL